MPLFIPSKTHDHLNGREFSPESITGTCMVGPHHRSVSVAQGIKVRCDSGAFKVDDMIRRLRPAQALRRQLKFEASLTRQGRPRFPDGFEYIVTYDMLVGVDEALVDGQRVKRRGSEESAEPAVKATIAAARLYHRARRFIRGGIAYAAQGVTPRQYLRCVRALLPLIQPGRDILALGGFCIIGMHPRLKPLFAEVCHEVAPLLRDHGVHEVHILGVFVNDALCVAAQEFGQFGIEVATDSSSVEVNSIMGKVWSEENMLRWKGASPWEHVYTTEEKFISYHPAELAIDNIRRASAWWSRQGPTAQATRTISPYQPTLW